MSLQATPVGQELLHQIQARLPRLSPTMRSVGGYCVRAHAGLHQMSIDEVASQCGTVPSSVVRFARLFGHRGFQDFKLAFLNRRTLEVKPRRGELADSHSRLLSNLDEDVHQLSELSVLLQTHAFQRVLHAIRAQPKLSLSFHGELDRMVAMHLGDALQRAGKSVLLTDQWPGHQQQPLQMGVTSIHIDLARPRLHAGSFDESAELAAGDGHCRINLIGTDRCRGAHASGQRLTLPMFGSTLSRRLQKALSLADAIEAALH